VPRPYLSELLVLWSPQKPVWSEVVAKPHEPFPLGVLGWRQPARIQIGRCGGWLRRAGTCGEGRKRSGSLSPRGPALPHRMTKFASTASQSVTPWIKIYSYNFSSLQTNSTLSPLLVKTQTHWIKGKPYLMYLESKFDWIPPKVDIIFYDVHALDVWLKFIKSILLVSH